MKTFITVLALAITCMGIGASYAAETSTVATKDECLLASKNCRDATLSIQQKIQKLQDEINKGKKVYTKEELKKLEGKLKETENILDDMMLGP